MIRLNNAGRHRKTGRHRNAISQIDSGQLPVMLGRLQRKIYQNEFAHPHHSLRDVLRWKTGFG